jgi:U3 small nucleolar RNA-associated protein 11
VGKTLIFALVRVFTTNVQTHQRNSKMSGASTMRNAVKRVTHKERAQPANRKKFGLLEKHKDYVVRAKDYKNKQSHLTKLRRKALDRNPDEFYFKMNTSQVRNGIHYINKDKNAKLDNSVISTLKTQDLGYITTKKSADDSKIRKLKENLHLIGEQRVKNHTVFVSSTDELDSFDAAEHFNTAPEPTQADQKGRRRRRHDRSSLRKERTTRPPRVMPLCLSLP